MAGKSRFPIHMFLGHKPCGCLVAVECDFGKPTPEVADWLRYGYRVSRIEVNEPVTVPTLCIGCKYLKDGPSAIADAAGQPKKETP